MHKLYGFLLCICFWSCNEKTKKETPNHTVIQDVTFTEVEQDEGEVINKNAVVIIYPTSIQPMELKLENDTRVYEVTDKYPAGLIALCKKTDSSHLARYETSAIKKLYYKTADNKIDSIPVKGNENLYRIYFFDKKKGFKTVSLTDWQKEWPIFFHQ